MQTIPELVSLESRKRIAETEAVKSYEGMIRSHQKEHTYDNLRYIFRMAISNPDYGGSRHAEALAMLYDLMDTIQHAINPDIKPTVALSND
jgi:hypothetical protein